jgi:UrcA family protein
MNRERREDMKRIFKKHGALLGVALLCPGLALADPISSVNRMTVSYSDLDLSRQDDALRLYKRIETAARKVCGYYGSRELASQLRFHACYQKAMYDAVKTVGSDKLSALQRDNTKGASIG